MTFRPARVSGSAATPPPAPRPTTTTSVFLSLVAMVRPPRAGLEEVVVPRGLVLARDADVHALVAPRPDHLHARIAQQVPAGEVRIPAMDRVREHAQERV